MNILRGPNSRPVVLAYQAGASLGAFGWGVTQRLLEDPTIVIKGATGASSGAISVCSVMPALIRGKAHRDGGRALAYQSITDNWHGLSEYQDSQTKALNVIKSAHEMQHEITEQWRRASERFTAPFKPFEAMDVFAEAAFGMFMRNMEWVMTANNVAMPYCPITGFIEFMEEKGKPIAFDVLEDAKDHFAVIGATHVPEGANPYDLRPGSARSFVNGEIKAQPLAASGNLPELVKNATYVNGEPLRDGGFSANPPLDEAARYCEQTGAELIVIRTRPSENPAGLRGRTPVDINERRTYFNSMLDRQLALLAETYPDLVVHVIEPSRRETFQPQRDPLWWWRPELRFHAPDIERRRQHGYNSADAFLEASPVTPRRIRNLQSPASDAGPISAVG